MTALWSRNLGCGVTRDAHEVVLALPVPLFVQLYRLTLFAMYLPAAVKVHGSLLWNEVNDANRENDYPHNNFSDLHSVSYFGTIFSADRIRSTLVSIRTVRSESLLWVFSPDSTLRFKSLISFELFFVVHHTLVIQAIKPPRDITIDTGTRVSIEKMGIFIISFHQRRVPNRGFSIPLHQN